MAILGYLVYLINPEDESGHLLQNYDLRLDEDSSAFKRDKNTKISIRLDGGKKILDHVIHLAIEGDGPDGHRNGELANQSSKLGLPRLNHQLLVLLLGEPVVHRQSVNFHCHTLQH